MTALACLALVSFGAAEADQRSSELEFASNEANLPSVAIIATGGTIAEETDPQTGGAVPPGSTKDLVAAVPGLSGIANIGVLLFSNIDSSRMLR